MINDLRHGVRTLLQTRGWTAIVVAVLALGIGANIALFSTINGLLLRTIPVANPDTLLRLRWAGENDMVTSSSDYGYSRPDGSGLRVRTTFSYPMFRTFVESSSATLQSLVACAPIGNVNMGVAGQAEMASAFLATGDYFQVLGVPARLGRTFGADDDRPSAAPVAVLSETYWRSRFGGAPDVIGRSARINGTLVTIIGVTPASFTGTQRLGATAPDVTMPVSLYSQLFDANEDGGLESPTFWWLQVMGRPRPGVSAVQVEANLDGVFRNAARAGLDSYLGSLSAERRNTAVNRNRRDVPHLRVDSGSRGTYDPSVTEMRAVAILSAVVVLILLIVCANVMNLLLSRAAARQREMSVRLSLGATRARLVRQLLTESLLLAGAGGALGLVAGYWGRHLLPSRLGEAAPVDMHVAGFSMALTGLTALLFGLAPAWRTTGVNLNASLKEGGRGVIGTRSFLTRGLVVAQIGISIVLLVGAGLFLRTVQNLRHVDVGFNPGNLVLFQIRPELSRYDDERAQQLYRQMLDGLGAVPGVASAALSQPALLSGSVTTTSFFVEGRTYAPDERASIHRLVVSPGFSRHMGIPLLLGRDITERDAAEAPKVAVINEAAAREYFPGESPIGRHFGSSVEASGEREIVGVLKDVKYNSLREPAPPTMYVPYEQVRTTSPTFAVRTAGDPLGMVDAIRRAVGDIDANLPLVNVSTQVEEVEERLAQERLFANAYVLFGGAALLLAAIGLFGLMSYSVARRTHEIGIRMALGAARRDVVGLVMRESMLLALAGTAAGVCLALGGARFVASQLFGVSTRDALTVVISVGVMLAVAGAAGYVPARRASRVDPMVALRDE